MRLKTGLILVLLVGSLWAQHGGKDKQMSPQNMDAVRIWKLTEVLELSEEQTVRFLPIVQIHERKLRDKQKELVAIGRDARSLLKDENVSQKDVDKLLKAYNAKHAEMAAIKRDFIQSLPEYLTPEQQILYLGFEARFRQDLRDFMKDRRDKPTRNRR